MGIINDTAATVIRAFKPRDRAAVRAIAWATAHAGQPADSFLSDRELCTDLLTSYYTDVEPESAWVAEQNGQVAGYLSGCRNTRRFYRIMAWRIVPGALWRATARGTLWDCAVWRLAYWNLGIWIQGLFLRRIALMSFPAHFHVNLYADFRGQRIGQRLVARFLEELQADRVPGVHARVREDNAGAIRFFD